MVESGSDPFLHIVGGDAYGSTSELVERVSLKHCGGEGGVTETDVGIPSWIVALFRPRFLPRDDGEGRHPTNREAIAWAMDTGAKGSMNMSGAFMAPALLILATEAAGEEPSSDGRVWGMRPSSLLTVASVVVTLAAASVMPLFGAVVDYTPRRRAVGLGTAALLILMNGAQSFVSSDTWPLMLLLLMLSNFLYVAHTTVVLAYLPELTQDEDELSGYTAWFSIVHFVLMSIYTIVVLVIAGIARGDTVYTAQMSHVVSFLFTAPLLLYAWVRLFRPRPALHDLPRGRSLATAGFAELASTTRHILGPGTPLPYLRIFMLTLLFSPDAGSGNYISIFVTFLSEQMQMTGGQIGFVTLFVLLSTIPGSFLSNYLCRKYDALFSFRLCLVWWIFTMTVAPLALTGPERAYLSFFPFSFMWGIQFGWLFPSQRVLFCTLIPPGKDTELMGMLAFFGQIMGWAPPLLFSWINELGWSMRLGLGSSIILLAVALFVSSYIDDYKLAVHQGMGSNTPDESITK